MTTTPIREKLPAFQANDPYINKLRARKELVIAHETAHQREAGPQASGSPVYDIRKDELGNEIYFSGHQGISIPAPVNSDAPLPLIEKTKTAAEYVERGALAPRGFDQLSGADEQIAFRASQLKSGADKAKAEKTSKGNAVGQNLDLMV